MDSRHPTSGDTIFNATYGLGAYVFPELIREVNERFGTPPKNVRVNVDMDRTGVL